MSEGSVLIRFKEAGLKAAAKTAERVEKLAKKAKDSAQAAGSAKGGANPDDDARVGRQKRLEKRAKRARRGRFGAARPGFGGVNFGEASEALPQLAGSASGSKAAGLATRGLGQIAGFALGGVVGSAVLQIAQTVVEDYVRNELAALERERFAPIRARLDQIERDDFSKRLQEDPALQRTIANNEILRGGLAAPTKGQRWALTPGPLGDVD